MSRLHYGHRGVTLLETVAGLALFGTLGVMLLVGMSSHLRILKQAAVRRQSALVAEDLLASWYSSARKLPRSTSGVWDRDRSWQFSLRPVRRERIGYSFFEVIQFNVWKVNTDRAGEFQMELLRPSAGWGVP